MDPEVNDIEVVAKENGCFVGRGHPHVVLAICEVPLGFAHKLHSSNLVQVSDRVWLMRELVCCLVCD